MSAASVVFALVAPLASVERERLLALLSDGERARHARMRAATDRDAWLVAHALVRRELGVRLGLAPATIPLGAAPGGRPVLDTRGGPALHFSLTHARGIAACAVTDDVDVGVDAESIDRDADVERLAARVLSPGEQRAFARLEGHARRERFFELWTLREALAKATGLGLGQTLGKVEIDLEVAGAITARFVAGTPDAGPWSFALARPSARHVLAVAVRAQNARIDVTGA